MTPEAERFNGWAAMLGFIAAVGAYTTTGQNHSRYLLMKKEITKTVEKEKAVAENNQW